jgi:phosphatidylserine decarboxylase
MDNAGAPENRSSSPQSIGQSTSTVDGATASGLRGWGRLLLALLYLVPKNGLSRLAGRIASLHLPGPMQRAEIRLFARLVGANVDEARDPVESYDSLQGFFSRALRDGVRPIQGDSMSVVAPCDGTWGAAGRIEAGMLLQVKGRTYSVADLLGEADLVDAYENGSFATFYLSPRDYHRFHTPAAGRIVRVDYHPGSLWPVNTLGLQGIDGLFARNERICAYLEVDHGEKRTNTSPIVLVAVGATMVGSVVLSFDDLRTNVPTGRMERRDLGVRAPSFARGEQWGHFEFGSTIVMLTPPDLFEIHPQPAGRALKLGEIIGRRRI